MAFELRQSLINIEPAQARILIGSQNYFWFFGNRCPSLPYLVVILCECGGTIQIEPNAAEKVADVGQTVATAFEHLDFVV